MTQAGVTAITAGNRGTGEDKKKSKLAYFCPDSPFYRATLFRRRPMKIRRIMSKAPTYCTPSCTAEMAASLMYQCDTGILPVVQDSLDLKLVGVVTDRDLCLAVIAARRDPAHTVVNECMTRNPICVGPEEEVGQAVDLMAEHQVRRLPVVDEHGRVLGMVSLADLIEQDAVSSEALAATLKKICAPSTVANGRRPRVA